MSERLLSADRLQSTRLPWRQVGIISALVMELALLVPWLRLILAPVEPPPAVLLLLWTLLIAILGQQVAHIVEGHRLKRAVEFAGSGLVLALALLLSINLVFQPSRLLALPAALGRLLRALPQLFPPAGETLLALAVFLVWRRGVASASSAYLAPGSTGFKFRIGVLLYVIYVLVAGPRAGLIPPLLPVFFLTGLLAMSIGRAYWLTRLRGAGEPPFTLQWVGSLLLLFGATVGAGVGLGRLIHHPLVYQAFSGVRQLLVALLRLVYFLMLPLLIAIEPWLQRLLAAIRGMLQGSPELLGEALEAQEQQAQSLQAAEPPAFFSALSEFIISLQAYWPVIRAVLIGLAVLLVVYLALRFRRERRRLLSGRELPRDAGETHAPAGGLSRGLAAVREAVKSWGRAVLRGQLRTAIIVRRIYSQLLALSEERGRERHVWETPLEFQVALLRMLPESESEVRRITEAYIQVRYGDFEQTENMVEQVRGAWQRIKRRYG